MIQASLTIFAGLAGAYLFLRLVLAWTQDKREPPAILTNIPFLEPLIRVFREKGDLHVKLRYVRLPALLQALEDD